MNDIDATPSPICIKSMKISNIITVSRMLLSPVFVVLLASYDRTGPAKIFVIVIVWVIYFLIEISDLVDGYVARRLKEASDLGKVLDPFADCWSRLSCFFSFTLAGIIPFFIFLIILYRDLWVNFLRLLTAKKGVLQAARVSGKIKAWVYASTNAACLCFFTVDRLLPFSAFRDILYYICLFFFGCIVFIAVWSGIDYSVSYFRGSQVKKNNKGVDLN